MAYRIINEGMGNALNPPGDAEHTHGVRTTGDAGTGYMSLRYALSQDWVPNDVKATIRTILAANPPQHTDEWERSVYTHFAHCYSPDGITRDSTACIIDYKDEHPPEHHLAYLFVKSFFPNTTPRLDLIIPRKRGD